MSNIINQWMEDLEDKKKKRAKITERVGFILFISVFLMGILIINTKYEEIFGYGFITLIILILTIFLLYNVIIQLSVKGWESVECIIIKSELFVDEAQGGLGTLVTHIPKVYFYYKIAEKEYISDKISFGIQSFPSRRKAIKKCEFFKTGTKHRCFVNPKNPEESVLIDSFQWSKVILYYISIALLAMLLLYNSYYR